MTSVVIVGSNALKRRLGNDSIAVADYDWIAPEDALRKFSKEFVNPLLSIVPTENGNKQIAHFKHLGMFENEITWDGTTAKELYDYVLADPDSESVVDGSFTFYFPSIDVLYTLKMSHRYLRNSPHFRKTMAHIHMLRQNGAKIPEALQDWFTRRETETYSYGHPKLNVTKDKFFADDAIPYMYDHDDIHEAIKLGKQPAYRNFIEDGEQVKCSKEKFDACSEYIKLCAVVEESCVLALERSLIPGNYVYDESKVYAYALEKVCTSITSGWFREYAWENYHKALEMYPGNYVGLFLEALQNGRVRNFNEARI